MRKTITTIGLLSAAALAVTACPRPGGEVPDQRIDIEAVSYDFRPDSVTVRPGTIRFVVSNAADEEHGFEVEGHGVEQAIESIEPGARDSLTVTLTRSGEYEMYCPVDNHKERGMVGTLTVAGGAGAAEAS